MLPSKIKLTTEIFLKTTWDNRFLLFYIFQQIGNAPLYNNMSTFEQESRSHRARCKRTTKHIIISTSRYIQSTPPHLFIRPHHTQIIHPYSPPIYNQNSVCAAADIRGPRLRFSFFFFLLFFAISCSCISLSTSAFILSWKEQGELLYRTIEGSCQISKQFAGFRYSLIAQISILVSQR